MLTLATVFHDWIGYWQSSSQILTEADIARKRKEQYDERMRNSAIANQRKAMMLKVCCIHTYIHVCLHTYMSLSFLESWI